MSKGEQRLERKHFEEKAEANMHKVKVSRHSSLPAAGGDPPALQRRLSWPLLRFDGPAGGTRRF